MGIMVYSLLWAMQDLHHQQYELLITLAAPDGPYEVVLSGTPKPGRILQAPSESDRHLYNPYSRDPTQESYVHFCTCLQPDIQTLQCHYDDEIRLLGAPYTLIPTPENMASTLFH